MNVVAEIQRINDLELEKGLTHTSASWHTKYRDSAWVYAGNLPHDLSEGDVLCILSQYGEIEDINLVRDSDSGKSKGFAFVKYEDARSCVLAVDNLTGSQVLGRTLRVDHVENYRLPKHLREKEEGRNSRGGAEDGAASSDAAMPGHAYKGQELASTYDLRAGHDLFAAPTGEGDRGGSASDHGAGMEKASRRRRKELRAQKRKEKELRKQEREERKRRKREKHGSPRSRRD